MSINHKREGNKLILTIDLAAAPYQSKSAIEKARSAWAKGKTAEQQAAAPFDVSSVLATMLAGTSGFERFGDCKVSLNVIKG